MRKAIIILLSSCLLWSAGCAELREMNRMMMIMVIELFRLPIYIMKIPFAILQNLGPIIQAAVRTGLNIAPLLLFIENRTEQEYRFERERGLPLLDGEIDLALSSPAPLPLLPVLEKEMAGGAGLRFALVDSRVLKDSRLRRMFLESLGSGGRGARCVLVSGDGILSEKERFLRICEKMRERGDSLLALTSFNEEISSLTGTPPDAVPPDARDRDILGRWSDRLEAGEGGGLPGTREGA